MQLKVDSSRKRALFTALLVILILGAAIGAYSLVHLHNVSVAQKTSSKVPNVSSKSQSTNISSNKDSVANPSSNSKSPSSDSSSNPNVPPITPFGTFISNHHPGQNGAPTSEQSVCNTTPGAICDIILTSTSGIVKDLGPKKADANGAVYWAWDIKGANMAAGTWSVSAKATLGSHTATASDSLQLETL